MLRRGWLCIFCKLSVFWIVLIYGARHTSKRRYFKPGVCIKDDRQELVLHTHKYPGNIINIESKSVPLRLPAKIGGFLNQKSSVSWKAGRNWF